MTLKQLKETLEMLDEQRTKFVNEIIYETNQSILALIEDLKIDYNTQTDKEAVYQSYLEEYDGLIREHKIKIEELFETFQDYEEKLIEEKKSL